MKLTLHYQKEQVQKANAFLIQGNSVENSLEKLKEYQLTWEEITCYVLPSNISNPVASSLFVVLHQEKTSNLFSFPYQKIGDKLFIPCNACIFPLLQEKKLNQLLLWDIQVFHPSIGLVGFEENQFYNIQEALVFLPNQTTLWNFAQKGINPPKELMEIRVEKKTEEEQLDSLKNSVEKEIGGKKPISDLKEPKAEEGFLKELKEKTKEKLLRGTQNILNSWKEKEISNQKTVSNSQNYSESDLSKLLSSIFGMLAFLPSAASILSNYNQSNTYEEKQSLLQKLDNWVNQQIDDIESKRKNEINRLLDLFDDNIDEALQYALPLNNPYADRGTLEEQQRSAELSKNDTDFQLGGLKGGGKTSDAWELNSEQYQKLRQKYEQAANQAIERKDYRKAAYVYANLLGDFQKAANVLEQGKFYHEAVAIYKKHLNNLEAAAQCYEKGGMLLEAIDLYQELNKDEKVGDLYSILSQDKKAKNFYDKCVQHALDKKDYIEAYRLQKDKLKDRSESKEILLKAWEVKAQEEYCLREYFLLEIEDNPTDVPQITQSFYQKLNEHEKITYLKVLDKVLEKHKEEEFTLATQKIAYQIVSEEISKNNINHFPLFQKFIPNDPLLFSDCTRFTKNFQPKILKKEEKYQEVFQIGSSHDEMDWFHIIYDNFTFIVFGLDENKQLVVIRSTLSGEQQKQIYIGVYIKDKNAILVQSQIDLSNTLTLLGKNYYQPLQQHIFEISESFSNSLILEEVGNFLERRTLSLLVLPYQNEMCVAVFSMKKINEIQLDYYIESKLLHSEVFFIENEDELGEVYDEIGMAEFYETQEMYLVGKTFVSLFGNRRYFLLEICDKNCKIQFVEENPIQKMLLYSKTELLLVCQNNIYSYQEGQEIKEIFECQESILQVQKMKTEEIVILVEKEFWVMTLEGNQLVLISKTTLQKPCVHILPTNKKGKYYFLEKTGKVVFYKV